MAAEEAIKACKRQSKDEFVSVKSGTADLTNKNPNLAMLLRVHVYMVNVNVVHLADILFVLRPQNNAYMKRAEEKKLELSES